MRKYKRKDSNQSESSWEQRHNEESASAINEPVNDANSIALGSEEVNDWSKLICYRWMFPVSVRLSEKGAHTVHKNDPNHDPTKAFDNVIGFHSFSNA